MSELDFNHNRKFNIESDNVEKLINKLPLQPESISPMMYETLTDPDLSKVISNISPEYQMAYLYHTVLFDSVYTKVETSSVSSSFYGEEITVPSTQKEDGSMRPAETGPSINLDYLREKGVDPNGVLIFRATQLSDTPKPENYWTTDYYETRRGLTAEMGPEKRKNAVILVSTIGQIAQNGGIIKDINDDNGLSVRRVDTGNFNQQQCIGIIK